MKHFIFGEEKCLCRDSRKKNCCEENEGWKGQFSCQGGKRPKKHCLFLKAAQQTSHVLQGLMSYNVYQRFRLNLRSLFLSHFWNEYSSFLGSWAYVFVSSLISNKSFKFSVSNSLIHTVETQLWLLVFFCLYLSWYTRLKQCSS